MGTKNTDAEKLQALQVAIDSILRLSPYWLGRTIGYMEGIIEKRNLGDTEGFRSTRNITIEEALQTIDDCKSLISQKT